MTRPWPDEDPDNPWTRQEGGTHYRGFVIEPSEFIHKNGIQWFAANVIKYVCRYPFKNGLEDLIKARHYLDLLIHETRKATAAND